MIETEQPKIDAYDGYSFTPRSRGPCSFTKLKDHWAWKLHTTLGAFGSSSFLLRLRATGGAQTTQPQPQSELLYEFLRLQ